MKDDVKKQHEPPYNLLVSIHTDCKSKMHNCIVQEEQHTLYTLMCNVHTNSMFLNLVTVEPTTLTTMSTTTVVCFAI